jgi:hypothetical protein
MVRATDSASMTPARRAAIAIGLLVCIADAGCARLSSFRQDNQPALGALSRAQERPARGLPGDLYAERQRPNLEASRAALAQGRAALASKSEEPGPAEEAKVARSAGEPPAPREVEPAGGTADPGALEVSLQPPVALPSGRSASSSASASRPRLNPNPKERPGEIPTARPPVEPSPESLVSAARAKLDGLKSYQVTLNRQDRVGQTLQEPEEVLLSIRRDPKAVRLEWPTGPHKGREVLYLASEDDGRFMHINAADAVIPVPPLKMPVDSPMVMSNARHPITEAGFDTVIGNLEKTIAATRAGDSSRGTLTYAGLENPGPLARPCHKLTRVIPPGETWQIYVDPETKLPAMVEATAANGDLLERYVFSNLRVDLPELASSDAFDPALRWGGPKGGLLNRLARSGAAAVGSTATAAAR